MAMTMPSTFLRAMYSMGEFTEEAQFMRPHTSGMAAKRTLNTLELLSTTRNSKFEEPDFSWAICCNTLPLIECKNENLDRSVAQFHMPCKQTFA
jgi:hypothetical protein